jgi:hypothetical protein
MALLLEVAMPPNERSPEFYTADERLQFLRRRFLMSTFVCS